MLFRKGFYSYVRVTGLCMFVIILLAKSLFSINYYRKCAGDIKSFFFAQPCSVFMPAIGLLAGRARFNFFSLFAVILFFIFFFLISHDASGALSIYCKINTCGVFKI